MIATDTLPPLRRARAWRIPFEVVAVAPALSTRTLVLRTAAVLDKVDLRRLLEAPAPARLVTAQGDALPAALAEPGRGLDATVWSVGPTLVAQGVSYSVTDEASARVAERSLWASLTSSSDGTVDRWFNRPVGRPLSKLLIHTPVTPNAVSLASIVIGVFAGYLFTSGEYLDGVIAAVVFQFSAIVDCVDGDVARAVYKETPLGKWLDLVGDQVVHASVFAGLAWGVAQDGGAVGVTVGAGDLGGGWRIDRLRRRALGPAAPANRGGRRRLAARVGRGNQPRFLGARVGVGLGGSPGVVPLDGGDRQSSLLDLAGRTAAAGGGKSERGAA